jgi:succinate dehydrogenase / fumarate reductase, cytochrome b subunit
MLGFWIQRLTGVCLLIYLFIHVRSIHLLRDPASFDAALDMFRNPLFKMMEIVLLLGVILHALNGIRITLLDLGVGVTKQRQLFWYLAIVLGAALFIAGAAPILIHGILF